MKKEIVPPWRPPISDPYFDQSRTGIEFLFAGLSFAIPPKHKQTICKMNMHVNIKIQYSKLLLARILIYMKIMM